MLFFDTSLDVRPNAPLPAGTTKADVLTRGRHVREQFDVLLGREAGRDHFLPDARRVVLELGPVTADDPGPGLPPNARYRCCLSVAHWRDPHFDVAAFLKDDTAAGDRPLYAALADAVREAADRQGVAAAVGPKVDRAEAAAAALTASEETRFLEQRMDKLGRTHRGRRVRFEVVRRFVRGGQRWRAEARDRAGALLETTEIGGLVTAPAAYHGSRWRGDLFQLVDARGKVRFQRSAGPALKRVGG